LGLGSPGSSPGSPRSKRGDPGKQRLLSGFTAAVCGL
jgi:hypothetical protein